ncbi:MAG: hypothetical protein ACREMV_15870 [Gemmatimonadales bacterium]
MTVRLRDPHHWLLVACFLVTLPFVNPYVRGDGNGYYAYVRSAVIDGDLSFENEFRRGDPAFRRTVFDDAGRLLPGASLVDGYVKNQWAVGPSLLWAPFFLVAHGVVWLLQALGVSVAADGYSAPYRWLCGVGTATYAFAGLLLAYRLAKRFVRPGAAVVAALAIWFGSSLPVYAYFIPFHVHALASFSVALLLWYWLRMAERLAIRDWVVWGAIAGLAVEVYQLNVVFLTIPLAELVREIKVRKADSRWTAVKRGSARALAFATGGVIALAPHGLIKWRIHGAPWRTGYADEFFWSSPRLFEVALSPEHGLLLWTPVIALALAGLVVFQRRQPWNGALLVTTFVVYYYVVASYQNWHGQSSFGSRLFVSFTPAFVIGLAELVHRARGAAAAAIVGVVVALILWNAGLMVQWGTNIIPNRGPVDMRVAARNQFTAVPAQLPGLLGRYFARRETMVRDVESGDLSELEAYRVRR